MSNRNIEKQIDEAVGSIKEEQSWLTTYADMMTLLKYHNFRMEWEISQN